MSDVEKFLAERKLAAEEVMRTERLVSQYKKNMPTIEARWDTTDQSIGFNDIDARIVSAGLLIYSSGHEALWSGLFDPGVYDANTLWSSAHANRKIAKVIEAWEKGILLSPIFLVRHGSLDLGLVADGKHRLTVSRAIGAREVPFMVARSGEAWVGRAIPSAVRIL